MVAMTMESFNVTICMVIAFRGLKSAWVGVLQLEFLSNTDGFNISLVFSSVCV